MMVFPTSVPSRLHAHRVGGGFTLLEVLVVIALFGLAGWAVSGIFPGLFESASKLSLLESLKRSTEVARNTAWAKSEPVRVIFDANSHELKAQGSEEYFKATLPAGASVRFFMAADETGRDERDLSSLDFHPAGCVTPAVIELGLSGRFNRYRIEPFSGSLSPETGGGR